MPLEGWAGSWGSDWAVEAVCRGLEEAMSELAVCREVALAVCRGEDLAVCRDEDWAVCREGRLAM